LVAPPKEAARDEVLAHLRRAMTIAGASIFDAAQGDPDLSGMGTTLTALLFHDGRMFLAHVGDSRAYLYRDGKVLQLTDDHSWVSWPTTGAVMTTSRWSWSISPTTSDWLRAQGACRSPSGSSRCPCAWAERQGALHGSAGRRAPAGPCGGRPDGAWPACRPA